MFQLRIFQSEFSHRRTEIRLAHVNLLIVAVFIACHAVKWIPNCWEWRQAETDQVSGLNTARFLVRLQLQFQQANSPTIQ